MTNITFKFNRQKAIETILFFANRVSEPTRLKVMKLIYLADKTSLEKYGRFISGDTYVAMKHGPVPSCSYDLVKSSQVDYAFKSDGNNVVPVRDYDVNEFSKSDVECLE